MDWNLSYDRTEFAVCFRDKKGEEIFKIPIEPGVEVLLQEVLNETGRRLSASLNPGAFFPDYDPSSKHAPMDPCQIKLDVPWLSRLRHVAGLVTIESKACVLQDNPEKAIYYLARFTSGNRTIIGLRRTSNFKADLKKRLITLCGHGLQEVESKVFRLDDVFDCVIDQGVVFILHPTSFEYLAEIEEQLRKHAADSVDKIDANLKFLDMTLVKEKVLDSGSALTARLIASIAARSDLHKIDRRLFADYCSRQRIKLRENGGIFSPEKGHEIELLKVLDRRLYDVELIPEEAERYEASSRHRI